VRDAAAKILENTTVADLVAEGKNRKGSGAKQASNASKKKATGA